MRLSLLWACGIGLSGRLILGGTISRLLPVADEIFQILPRSTTRLPEEVLGSCWHELVRCCSIVQSTAEGSGDEQLKLKERKRDQRTGAITTALQVYRRWDGCVVQNCSMKKGGANSRR